MLPPVTPGSGPSYYAGEASMGDDQRRWRRPRLGTLEAVRAFWEAEACGERYTGSEAVDYAALDATRYRLEPQVPPFARFEQPFSGFGLEIGTGMGSDFSRNLARGGRWVGLDLTSRSLDHVRARCGRDVPLLRSDAQSLPLRTDTFDLVYSWGVMLHCPHPGWAINEAHRVLKPGGEALVMLYHSPSWVSLAAWLRWGWFRGLSPRQSVSYIESPGTQAFSARGAARLFSRFREVSVQPVQTSWDTRWWGPIGRVGGDTMGWFLLCRASK